MSDLVAAKHSHVFLGAGHEVNERKTWGVIILCGCMMAAEIVGGLLLGSIALVADGLHMSTHAGALLLAALAYRYARRHADDPRFSFGTGKLGDLAGFTSAIVLAMIAVLVGYEAISRFFSPVPIQFDEAIAIAVLGLLVNAASVWILSGGDGGRHHGHAHAHHDDDHDHDHLHEHHAHGAVHHDYNLRGAFIHVMGDLAVSVMVIVGLLLARFFGLVWMDPAAALLGAFVIASWAYTLVRDTGRVLLDMTPDAAMAEGIRAAIEGEGDRLTDLHLWRLGPGHMGAIISVCTAKARPPQFYRERLLRFSSLSHVTIEVDPPAARHA